jgi:hypothetical protein
VANPHSVGVSSVGDRELGGAPSDVFVGDGRASLHQCADEPPEDEAAVAGVAPIEPEDELIEVAIEVLVRYSALVSAEKPTLEK